MENFKIYLESRIKKLETELKNLEVKIEYWQNEHEINLENYGTLKELKKEYRKQSSKKIYQKLFITKKELETYISEKELNELTEKSQKLNKILHELRSAFIAISGNRFIDKMENTNNVIKEYLNYLIIFSEPVEESLRNLIAIFKATISKESVIDKIKGNIATFFDENNNIISNTNYGTLNLLFEKLFLTLLTEKEQEEHNINIISLLHEIKIQCDINLSAIKREELQVQKEAIIKLQEYIAKNQIKKATSDIEYFKELLNKSGLKKESIENLLYKMQEKIEQEKEIASQIQQEKIIQKFLTENEILDVRKSIELEREFAEPIKTLINKLRNDVVSLCKYLELIESDHEFQNSLEILTKRMNVLRDVIKILEENKYSINTFFYFTSYDQVPLILRTIESTDIVDYPEIYSLLEYLATNPETGTKITDSTEPELFELASHSYKLVFSRKNSKIVIINVYKSTLNSEKKSIKKSSLNRLKEIFANVQKEELQQLHSKYEELILSSLNLNFSEKPPTLKKSER